MPETLTRSPERGIPDLSDFGGSVFFAQFVLRILDS
jgi:hypothetical protein